MITFKTILKNTVDLFDQFSRPMRIMLVLASISPVLFILANWDRRFYRNKIFLDIGWLFELSLYVFALMLIAIALRKKYKELKRRNVLPRS
jgi:hypothetical protein